MHMECSPVGPLSRHPVSQDISKSECSRVKPCAFLPAFSPCPSYSEEPEGDPVLRIGQLKVASPTMSPVTCRRAALPAPRRPLFWSQECREPVP